MISLRDRVLVFFSLNPGEELTRMDCVTKYGATRGNAAQGLDLMVVDGLLVRDDDRPRSPAFNREIAYRIGPKLIEMRRGVE